MKTISNSTSETRLDLPKKIRIGPYVYAVEVVDKVDDENSDGEIRESDLTIRIKKGKPAYMASTLFHETLHGVWADLPEGADEEAVVSRFELGLLQLLKDNPRFFPWLRRMMK